jgi:hypothetical protein
MTPLEILIFINLIVIPLAIAAYKVWGRDQIKNEKLCEFIDHAVAAAEELHADNKLPDASQQDYVYKLVDEYFPSALKSESGRRLVDMLVHASVAKLPGSGKTGKALKKK